VSAVDERLATAPEKSGWLAERERGAVLGVRIVFVLATIFGRFPARQVVKLVALYYALFDSRARAASRDFFQRVYGRAARFADVYAHVHRFAQVTLDRMFFLRGIVRPFEVTRTGNHHLIELTRTKTGAILLGAHLGSFDAMRASGVEEHFPITIVGHFENAKMINALLQSLDPEMAQRVLHVGGGDPIGFAMTLRERIEAGEMVAMMGDRVGLNDKTVEATFFGAPASFPAGPFLVASMLKCPVYLTFGIYREPNRYDLSCEPFAERIVLPRQNRQAALAEIVQKYAARLEEKCRSAPDNWFNFYDFWETSPR
jgi:predicted LPLAT superfamily acyltransferase